MDQSVIETMKRHYRNQVLKKLLVEGEDEAAVLVNHKKWIWKSALIWWGKLGAWLRQWKMLEGISTEGEKEKKKKEKEAPVTEREETGENEGDLSFKGLRFVWELLDA